jgi:long-chain acyl-CoA synthetase
LQRDLICPCWATQVWLACYARANRNFSVGVLPLFNNLGATVVLNGAFYSGGTLVLRERWDLDGVVADIERHKISVFFGAPTMFTFLLMAYDPRKHDLSSLRLCVAGGTILVPSLFEEFETTLKTRLINIYGASSVSIYVTAKPLLGPRIPGSVGLTIGATTISVGLMLCPPAQIKFGRRPSPRSVTHV